MKILSLIAPEIDRWATEAALGHQPFQRVCLFVLVRRETVKTVSPGSLTLANPAMNRGANETGVTRPAAKAGLRLIAFGGARG